MVNTEAIQKAILAHSEWKVRLQKAIETGKVDVDIAQVKADNNCQFGKWLYSEELTPAEKQTVHYGTVRQLHARFHVEAASVLELARAGKKDQALKAMGLVGSYDTASNALTNALTKWQAALGT